MDYKKRTHWISHRNHGVNLIDSRWVLKKIWRWRKFTQAQITADPIGIPTKAWDWSSRNLCTSCYERNEPIVTCVAADWRRSPKKGDVTNAFHTTKLVGSKTHMAIPDGFELLHPEIDKEKFCFLWYNTINGLKQYGHDFNQKLDRFLKDVGFRRNQEDPCLYFQRQFGKLLLVVIRVYDFLNVGECNHIEEYFNEKLQQKNKINHKLLEDINDYLKSIGYLNYLSLSSRLDVMGVTSISSAYS